MNDQMIARKEKLEKLRDAGIAPYPHTADITCTIGEILSKFTRHHMDKDSIQTAGRLTRLAKKGKITFADLSDEEYKIQLVLSKKELQDQYSLISMLNSGDFIEVTGTTYLTNTGQESLYAQSIKILCKSLRPLPAPKKKKNDDGSIQIFDEFSDTELRYRRRPVDLLLNADSLKRFRTRSRIISSIRGYLDSRGYIEVQTPVLQNTYGGASARPFRTEYNALGMDVYLRISNELYLKQCIVGGMNRVYEIGKDFRNEGIDRTHSPEFTMIEFYEAYADYRKMMLHFEQIFYEASIAVSGSPVITYGDTEIDLSPPWKRITFYDAITEYSGVDPGTAGIEDLRKYCDQERIELPATPSRGEMLIAIFEDKVEPRLIQPHIVYDYPKESTPLCKAHRSNPDLVEQFEPYINGWEMGNAYTELNDPELQRSLLSAQSARGRGKDGEEYPADESFLEALEYGMPPTGGAGIGIDRMVMLLTGSTNIRDVILFPLMKPEQQS